MTSFWDIMSCGSLGLALVGSCRVPIPLQAHTLMNELHVSFAKHCFPIRASQSIVGGTHTRLQERLSLTAISIAFCSEGEPQISAIRNQHIRLGAFYCGRNCFYTAKKWSREWYLQYLDPGVLKRCFWHLWATKVKMTKELRSSHTRLL